METKSSGVAIVLSCFWTGLGQLYAGRIVRGALMMVATPVIWGVGWTAGLGAFFRLVAGRGGSVGVVGALLGVCPAVFWLWGMSDARRLCLLHNARRDRGVTPVEGYPAIKGDR
jgi:TM2 domain-containing membrane protein YozV